MHRMIWVTKRNHKEKNRIIINNNSKYCHKRYVKVKIYSQHFLFSWIFCKERDKTVNHIISECSKLTLKEFKNRHNWIGNVMLRELCKWPNSACKEKWYMYKPEAVLVKKIHKILWDKNETSNPCKKIRCTCNE